MGLDFKIRDFAHPLAIWRTKKEFERHQYLAIGELEEYQLDRLKRTLSHAYDTVRYYRALFDANDFHPSQMMSLADTARIPLLTRRILSQRFADLTATGAARYGPRELCTSGTTGSQVRFLVDRASNVLEFVYYWRFWGWHGYRLGSRFAEWSAESFLPIEDHRGHLFRFDTMPNRLVVNSLLLSRSTARAYVELFKRYRPLFLKGLPSNLYAFALLCREVQHHGITFRAVFSQGENLSRRQRAFIEEVFSCPVFDSYGHLERTVAISQCPHGRYHVHSDYGLAEFVKPHGSLDVSVSLTATQSACEVVGTSLHNASMPLIRYRTQDLVVLDAEQPRCPCQRSFPVVQSILGRDADIIVTPSKKAITALYTAIDRVPGLACAQIVQESLDTLLVRVARWEGHEPDVHAAVVRAIRAFAGDEMRVIVRDCPAEEIYGTQPGKFRSVISHVDPLALVR